MSEDVRRIDVETTPFTHRADVMDAVAAQFDDGFGLASASFKPSLSDREQGKLTYSLLFRKLNDETRAANGLPLDGSNPYRSHQP